MKTCVSGLNALYRGTKVAKHPFYSIKPKMMFTSVSEHFDVKRCKTCVSGLDALFGGTKVTKHPFYSIGPKMMFGCVTKHFANLRHVKDAKIVLQVWMHNFEAPKFRSIHSTPSEPKWCLGVFRSTSVTFGMKKMKTCASGLNALFRRTKDVKHPFYSIWPKMIYVTVMEHFAKLVHVKIWKLVFRVWMHYFGVPKLRSIHSTPLDPKWYMWLLRSTSLILCM
jgi:hypothetical protein